MFEGKNWLKHALAHNVEQIVTEKELRDKLKRKKQLRIKYGVDVTSPFIHIGHAVNLWKMREFQEHGHRVVFLIGDFTTLIGDPTDKLKIRSQRTEEEIGGNAKTYIEQITKILSDDPEVFEVRRNSEWYSKMSAKELLGLCSKITHARLIQRDMFRQRVKSGGEIYMHEMLYPILQGYDSYILDSDLTVVGGDQLFNELLGRHYQEMLGQEAQVLMTTTITPGLDGKEKQSKSLGNYIAILDKPEEKFGKIMSLPDNLIITYYRVYTFIDAKIIDGYEKQLKGGLNPRDIKLNLATDLVALYHGEDVAKKVRENFIKVFSKKGKPSKMPEIKITNNQETIINLLLTAGIKSKSQARRLIEQGGVKIDDEVKKDPSEILTIIKNGSVLQIGRRRFYRLKAG